MENAVPAVNFVVCARNNREIIASTLEAISRQGLPEFTCTLVDGCSTDGTPEFVRQRFPWVVVIEKQEDSGPSHSRNLGWQSGAAEFVVLVDSDVALDPDWTKAQLSLMQGDPGIGIAGGKLLFSPRPELLYSAYGVMSRYGVGWDGGRAEAADQFTSVRNCLWINSSAMVLRRKMLEQIGGFDNEMFLGSEDADLGWRANLFGWRVCFNPSASALHNVHGTLDPATMSNRLIHLIWRNRLRSCLINYQLASLARYTTIFLAISTINALLLPPRRPKLSALWWNMTHIAGTLSRRRWIQQHRVVSDRTLWPLFRFGFRGPGYDFYPRARRNARDTSPGSVISAGGNS